MFGWKDSWLEGREVTRKMFLPHYSPQLWVLFPLLGLPFLPLSYRHLHNLPSHPASVALIGFKMTPRFSQFPSKTPRKIQTSKYNITPQKQNKVSSDNLLPTRSSTQSRHINYTACVLLSKAGHHPYPLNQLLLCEISHPTQVVRVMVNPVHSAYWFPC